MEKFFFKQAKTTKCEVINNSVCAHTIFIFLSSHCFQLIHSHQFISLFQVVFDIRIKAIKELKLMKELGNHLRLLLVFWFNLVLFCFELKKLWESTKNDLGKTHPPTTQNGQTLSLSCVCFCLKHYNVLCVLLLRPALSLPGCNQYI